MKLEKKKYLRNVLSNYSSVVTNICLTFILTPFVINSLGDQLYGYWVIIVAFTGYFGFLDFGVRAGVNQYVTRYLALEDIKSFNKVVNTSLVAFIVVCCFGFLISFFISFFFAESLFKTDTNIKNFNISIFIVGLSISLKFPFVIFQSIINAKQRFDITSGIAIFWKILNSIILYYGLLEGFDLLFLALLTFFTQLGESVFMLFFAGKLVPEIQIDLKFTKKYFYEFAGYGAWSFIMNIGNHISFYIGPIIIGATLGAVSVTYYSVANNLFPYLVVLVQSTTIPLYQIAINFDSTGYTEKNKILILQGTKYLFWLVSLFCINLMISGELFLRNWVGEKYLSGSIYVSSGMILKILTIGYMFYLSQSVSRQVLFGQRKNKVLGKISIVFAVLVIFLTYILSKYYGLIGAAYGLVGPLIIANLIFIPVYVSLTNSINLFRFYAKAILPVVTPFIITYFIVLTFNSYALKAGWINFFVSCFFTSCIFLIISFFFFTREIMTFFNSLR